MLPCPHKFSNYDDGDLQIRIRISAEHFKAIKRYDWTVLNPEYQTHLIVWREPALQAPLCPAKIHTTKGTT